MGIENLTKFLKSKFPNVFEEIHISEYAFKRVAVDAFLYLFRLKTIYWDERIYGNKAWLAAFIRLVACLRENEVHCIFVYDTKDPTFTDKDAEKKRRYEDKEKRELKVFELEQAIEKYHSSQEIDPILIEFQKKRDVGIQPLIGRKEPVINMKGIEQAVRKMSGQLVRVSQEDIFLTKHIFDLLDVPYIDAVGEGEKLCADLCIQGKVDAVLSEDTDVLCYGSPHFLTKLATDKGTCIRIDYENLLTEMQFTHSQFLDFCIMCGTDYNSNIYKVGPVKAYSLIKEYGTIENIAENVNLDISVLNHVRVREIFRSMPKYGSKLSYCGFPKFDRLKDLIIENRIKIDIDGLQKSFIREIVFEDSVSTSSSVVIVEESN